MILVWLMLIPFLGGLAALASERLSRELPRTIALTVLIIDLLLVLLLILTPDTMVSEDQALLMSFASGERVSDWQVLFTAEWIPRFGINFLFGADGLTLLLIVLTLFLGLMSLGAAWQEINERSGFFYFNLLWTLAGVIGVFTALDLFLFFVFWEVMLIPMYFMIAIWGHENRGYAAMKFFIFTQLSGLLMLVSILTLVFFSFQTTQTLSFSYFDLLDTSLPANFAFWIMLGFFIAFAVKLPSVPFHNWLPDAHSQAPTAGSMLLAGILLKTGAYGLLRFNMTLFPVASANFAPIAMTLGVISILYAAMLAYAQTDLKRLIAYTSISHMGFVMLGIYAWNIQSVQGAVMTMLAHGLSAAALFMVAGGIQHRIHTRDMAQMGGFWGEVPKLAFMCLFFTIAAVGMPGLGNFIGEFLVLFGSFKVHIPLTALAALGLIVAAIYSLIVIQKVFHGENRHQYRIRDLGFGEMLCYCLMMLGLVWMGMYPASMLSLSEPALRAIGVAFP